MVVAGLLTVVFGAELVPREGVVTPDVDTEMRFYAVWYAAAGIALLRAIPRIETSASIVRWVGTAFFIAGAARALSWIAVGRPHTQFVVLMVVELLLAVVIVPWQAAVRKDRGGSGPSAGEVTPRKT